MHKDAYKLAVNDIKAGTNLKNDTARAMKEGLAQNKSSLNRYFIASCSAIIVAGLIISSVLVNRASVAPDANTEGDLPVVSVQPSDGNHGQSGLQSQLASVKRLLGNNYIPFHATEYVGAKVKAPSIPINYEELKAGSAAIVVGTLSEIGVYRNKAEQYHPKASFGTYIYTIKIDRILSGRIEEKTGDYIPVKELALANPEHTESMKDIKNWRFSPYTFRADEAMQLEKEKQYVLFLSQKDDTEVYELAWDGFGVFPVDYIEQEAMKSTLGELRKEYEQVEQTTRSPLEHDLLYRLCGLSIREELVH